MTDYKDGDVITVNGKPHRIEAGVLVPVVQRGPLGGEMVPIESLRPGQFGYTRVEFVSDDGPEFGDVHVKVNANKAKSRMIKGCLIETNIPPRPTFTTMTAGEFLDSKDWNTKKYIAVRTEGIDQDQRLVTLGGSLDRLAPIYLIEGVDL